VNSHGYNWRDEPEGTAVSSVLLLFVFVAAAVFLVAMALMTPWDSGSSAQTDVVIPPSPPAEGAAPPAVEQPPPAQ
jgi:hypothetical protein